MSVLGISSWLKIHRLKLFLSVSPLGTFKVSLAHDLKRLFDDFGGKSSWSSIKCFERSFKALFFRKTTQRSSFLLFVQQKILSSFLWIEIFFRMSSHVKPFYVPNLTKKIDSLLKVWEIHLNSFSCCPATPGKIKSIIFQ